MDMDYDFSVTGNIDTNAKDTEHQIKNTDKKDLTPTDLIAKKLNLVLAGKDTDSVSTLGNPLSPSNLGQKNISTLLGTNITPTSSSVLTENTLDSRVTAIEEQITKMEENLSKGLAGTIEKTLNTFMSKLTTSSAKDKPLGGNIAERNNE